ncbi:MAG: four helix bundle protein, partial [Deltaproteobacteria bacterium]|nr:four helix bundle protein [Deltaproteobacteria bacterium]
SAPANIAEGQAREMPKAFANHLGIAQGSLAELLVLAVRLGYLTEDELTEASARIIEIRRLLFGLIRKLRAQLPSTVYRLPTTDYRRH